MAYTNRCLLSLSSTSGLSIFVCLFDWRQPNNQNKWISELSKLSCNLLHWDEQVSTTCPDIYCTYIPVHARIYMYANFHISFVDYSLVRSICLRWAGFNYIHRHICTHIPDTHVRKFPHQFQIHMYVNFSYEDNSPYVPLQNISTATGHKYIRCTVTEHKYIRCTVTEHKYIRCTATPTYVPQQNIRILWPAPQHGV